MTTKIKSKTALKQIRRLPIELTLRMVSRILNSEIPAIETNLRVGELERFESDPAVGGHVREEGRNFLQNGGHLGSWDMTLPDAALQMASALLATLPLASAVEASIIRTSKRVVMWLLGAL